MNSNVSSQWKRREGYGGPESFPENELAAYAVGETGTLAGKELTLHLTDGRVLQYAFRDATNLSVNDVSRSQSETCTYTATEAADEIFFVRHDHPGNDRLTTCIVLDLKRNQVVLVDGEIPAEGDADYRVRKHHVGGCIDKPPSSGKIEAPPFPPNLVGKNFVAEYSEAYAWELIYMNTTRVAWQGLKGNPGIGDVEEYHANQFAPGVYAVSWSEDAETLAAVFLYNFEARTITGHMWGYAPEEKKILHAPLGGRIVHPAEYGLRIKQPDEIDEEIMLEKNKEAVLRQHYEVWNEGRYDVIDEIYTEDYIGHFPGGETVKGRDAIKAFVQAHRVAFPDWHEVVVDTVVERDRVVTRYQSTGTHKGKFQQFEATGNAVDIPEASIYRMVDGKIAEQWAFPESVCMEMQLSAGQK